MKVLVGMSGGIDSSVAAYLLKKAGYEVEGITMLIWKKDSPYPAPVSANSCYCPDKSKDLESIDRVALILGIKHHVVDCSDVFQRSVLEAFRTGYLEGITPNPCIQCNSIVKFGAMVDYARSVTDFDLFATGHYARVRESNGRYELLKAKDTRKDQSYFLSRLSQRQLSSVVFPLGDYTKDEIRDIDVSMGFHEDGMAESQDFYGGDYSDLLAVPDRPGSIILPDGKVIGSHNGYWHYTIGQRKGLGVAYSEPLYVIDIDPERNTVIVGTEDMTHISGIDAVDPVFSSSDHFEEGKVYQVKIRSTAPGADAYVHSTPDGFSVDFISYVKGAAPGQSAVVYDGERVIASGFISSRRSMAKQDI